MAIGDESARCLTALQTRSLQSGGAGSKERTIKVLRTRRRTEDFQRLVASEGTLMVRSFGASAT